MKKRYYLCSKMVLTLFVSVTFVSCASHYATTMVGGEYDAKKDVTEYFVFPFGAVSLPGKWDKTAYNTESKQQFFTNKDSIWVAVAFGRSTSYEFNKDGLLKGNDFLNAFYEWDSKYFKDSYGLEWKILETDNLKNYMIYRIYGILNGSHYDSFFLTGEINGNVSSFSVNTTDKWSENEKILFLKNLYLQNK